MTIVRPTKTMTKMMRSLVSLWLTMHITPV